MGLFIIIFFFALIIKIFEAVVNYYLFKKAGKEGWYALIPVYNKIVLLEIIGYNWYYIFLFALGTIPVIGWTLEMLYLFSKSVKLAKSFGKDLTFGIGLWLLTPVFLAIIAFNKDIKYVGPAVKGDIDLNDLF